MKFIILSLLYMTLQTTYAQHIIPKTIENEAKTALCFYPELQNTRIEFRFKENINKSTMLAQPVFWTLFKSRKKRKYLILISKSFKISGKKFKTKDIASDILIGWLGHELGHISDYRFRSSLNLIWFGIKYTFSDSYIKEAERSADSFAVAAGMADFILKTKLFILNHADIDDSYKERIKKYYLSPEEILQLIKEQDSKASDF